MVGLPPGCGPFRQSRVTVSYQEVLANGNDGSLVCNMGAGGLVPAAGAEPAGGPVPSTTAAPAKEKKVEAEKEESEESDDDMGFGLFD
ncbi:hypothetical protein ABFV05_020591 [Capra hircus]